MQIRERNGRYQVVELDYGDQVQLLVPASQEQNCVYLAVDNRGRLKIKGGSRIISEISGHRMKEKFKE